MGDPLNRTVEKVLEDVRGGLVSRAAAKSVYGVVVEVDGGTVDLEATAQLRTPQFDRGAKC